jgi:DNA repair protein RadD
VKAIMQREYQQRAVKALPGLLRAYRSVLAVAPTGSGKTVIAVMVLMLMPRARVLWVVHSRELVKQAREQLLLAGIQENEIGMLTSTKRTNPGARVLVATVGMFRRRPAPEVDIVVVDEAHHVASAQYEALLAGMAGVYVMGLTATPWRLDGKPLAPAFKHLYVMADPIELIADKHISHALCYGIEETTAREIVSSVRGSREFNRADLGKAMAKRVLMGDIIKEWERLARDRSTIVFAVNRKHGRALAARFRKLGVTVEYLDALTPTIERDGIIARLNSGETQVVVNVDVLSEGFDCEPVKCVVLARPTKSLTRYLQQVGRGSRPHGNLRPIIIDHAGNCWRFDLPESPRDWSLTGRATGDGRGAPPLRRCPVCTFMMPISALVCPECRNELPAIEREPEESAQLALKLLAVSEADRLHREAVIKKLARLRGLNGEWVKQQLGQLS